MFIVITINFYHILIAPVVPIPAYYRTKPEITINWPQDRD